MALYENFLYSNFPESIDNYEYMQDVTIDTYALVQQYQSLINQKKFSDAAQYLIDNPELDRSMFNAIKYNKLIDSIKSIETLYSEDVKKYILELMSFKGEYNNLQKYIRYNVVIYASMVYLCILDCPLGTLPTNTTYWYPLSIKGDQGVSGIGLSFEKTWSGNISYSKDSCVAYNNCLYASVVDNNLSHTPAINSEYWSLVVDFNTVTSYNNSSSNLSSTTMQNAIDEVNTKVNTNTSNITTNTTNIASNTSSISNINSRISNIDNIADKDKSVKYATSAGSAANADYATNSNYANAAGTASTCTGNAATATKATNATNSDTVDGFHFKISTTDLTAGSSTLATNTFYFVYE